MNAMQPAIKDVQPAIEAEDYRQIVFSKLLLLAAIGFTVYLNSLIGVLVLDDQRWVIDNPTIRSLSLPGDGWLSTRRVVLFTFAVNHAVSGVQVWSYHLVNIVIHILAGLTLFGIVCRTLLRTFTDPRSQEASPWLAFAAAVLWLIHPLQTQSVTYISMRSESLMGLFYLVTLYCVIRGADASPGALWYGLAVAACALGMGCREDMVTAPLTVLLYDRIFLADSFGTIGRRRWGLYIGLAATLVLLLGQAPLPDSSPLPRLTPTDYLLTQPAAILHYLRLALVPYPLVFDYSDWAPETAGGAALPAVVVALLLALTVWALIRYPRIGFLGAWFFLTLLPSALIPGGPLVAEWRMYLPLAGLVVLFVVGGYALARRLLPQGRLAELGALVVAAVVGLTWGFLAFQRNTTYYTVEGLWQDTVARRPGNALAHLQLGNAYIQQQKPEPAIAEYQTVLDTPGNEAIHQTARNNLVAARILLGNLYLEQGKPELAIAPFKAVLAVPPTPESHDSRQTVLKLLGLAFLATGRYDEAREFFLTLPSGEINLPATLNQYGYVLWERKQFAAAARFFQEAIRLQPKTAKYHFNLAAALADSGKQEEAAAAEKAGLELDPKGPPPKRVEP